MNKSQTYTRIQPQPKEQGAPLLPKAYHAVLPSSYRRNFVEQDDNEQGSSYSGSKTSSVNNHEV